MQDIKYTCDICKKQIPREELVTHIIFTTLSNPETRFVTEVCSICEREALDYVFTQKEKYNGKDK